MAGVKMSIKEARGVIKSRTACWGNTEAAVESVQKKVDSHHLEKLFASLGVKKFTASWVEQIISSSTYVAWWLNN